ncbi:ATP-binding cassette domain-containing protein [Vibrio tapetis]|uniref:Putative sulfate/thiosulfate transporter subunit: ATP-binding component of ABC superfamily transporter n=1 Tax=Vibrio tapetis subsp. tapetis TaxID=1671868 RepID=A0A2N8Z8U7_9VIBR|nr:ATP-binding cassette domain-containing protein [Vibrio tapetis]SON48334.1 putative sulfate/thiosulfate transporter subunit: ATP-binding component of ABC superfamily transporter [Vibrio tapetis subsp. tapetis]
MTLAVENLTIYDRQQSQLFQPLSFTVSNGEVLSLMGPSGCGKSTLLNALAGHLGREFSFSGGITLAGTDISNLAPHKRKVGILFQEDLLFPHLNVWENLAFALPNSVKGQQRQTQALHALEKLGLESLANSLPNQISGGQRARVSLIRMLLAKPKLALLDEPFSKLDQSLRTQFRDWIFEQLSEANIPTVMVTHDQSDVPDQDKCLVWPWNQVQKVTHHVR